MSFRLTIGLHRWRQSIVKTVDSYQRIYCYFYTGRQAQHTGLKYEIQLQMISNLTINSDREIKFFLYQNLEHIYLFVYFKSKIELNDDRFVDLNILAYIRIYESIEFCSFSLT